MKNKNLLIGSHVSLKAPEYYLGSVKEALSYDANTFMVYTGAPQNTIRKDVQTFKVEEALQLMDQNNINHTNIIVHAPYIINLCSAKPDTRELAISFLTKELTRTAAMKANKLVLHPGCSLKQEYSVAIKQVADGINIALEQANNDVSILIETMAGKGTEVGTSITQIKDIINQIKQKNKIGVCLDTCHLSDSGIDLNEIDNYLNEFDIHIGIDKIKCIHINDSKNPMHAHKDRHENLGYGYIGFDAIMKVIDHPKLAHIPKILETPYVMSDDNLTSVAPYKQEIKMIRNKEFVNWLKKDLIK